MRTDYRGAIGRNASVSYFGPREIAEFRGRKSQTNDGAEKAGLTQQTDVIKGEKPVISRKGSGGDGPWTTYSWSGARTAGRSAPKQQQRRMRARRAPMAPSSRAGSVTTHMELERKIWPSTLPRSCCSSHSLNTKCVRFSNTRCLSPKCYLITNPLIALHLKKRTKHIWSLPYQ